MYTTVLLLVTFMVIALAAGALYLLFHIWRTRYGLAKDWLSGDRFSLQRTTSVIKNDAQGTGASLSFMDTSVLTTNTSYMRAFLRPSKSLAFTIASLFFVSIVFGQSETRLPDGDVSTSSSNSWAPYPLFSKINAVGGSVAGSVIINPTNSNSSGEVSFQNPTNAGTYTGVELKFIARKGASAGNERGLNAEVFVGASSQGLKVVQASLTDVLTEYTVTWPNLNFTQAQMNDLRVVFYATGITGGSGSASSRTVEIDYLEAKLTYTPPVVATAPTVTTGTASSISTTSATLNGKVIANNASTAVIFNYGINTSYGTNAPATPSSVTGNTETSVTASLTGLLVNTQYNFRVSGTNSAGTTNGLNSSFYTLANTPTQPTVNGATITSLSVTLGPGDGNPNSTTYAIQEVNSGNYVQANGSLGSTAIWQTSSAWGPKTVIGLNSNTSYSFKVKARNGDNVETAFGPSANGNTSSNPSLSATTLATFGSICIGTTSGPNTFTLTGSNLTSNVSVGPLAGFTYSTTGEGYVSELTLIPSSNGSINQVVHVLFSPTAAQTYNGNIEISGGGTSGPINVAATGSGLNTKPTVTAGAAIDPTLTSATIPGTISANGCSAVTAYGIFYSTTDGFADGAGTQVAGANLASGNFSVNLTGLTQNTTYYYKTYATNGGGTSYSAQGSFTTTANTAPVANDGSNSGNEDGGAITGTISATDANGHSLTYELVSGTNPSTQGTLTFTAATGAYSFAPKTNFNGTASFTFRANDGIANSNTATFTITVNPVNDAPSGADKTISIAEDASYTFQASDFGFTDPDDAPANTLQGVKITTLPANGTLKLDNVAVTAGQVIPVISIDNLVLVFSPAGNANGNPYTSFTFQVQDNGGTANGGVNLDPSANIITVNVTAVNDAPVATPQSITTAEDVVKEGTLAGTDAEGSALTFAVASQPGHGTVEINADGTFTYTPATNYNGPDAFTFTVRDGDLTSAPATVSINVTAVNDAPMINFTLHPDLNEDEPLELNLLGFATDPEGDAMTLELGETENGTAKLVDGNFVFTPTANFHGVATFSFRVKDAHGAESGWITVDIFYRAVNDAPVAATEGPFTIEEDGNVVLNVLQKATDAEGDALTIVPGSATNGFLEVQGGQLVYSALLNYNGPASFTYQVRDASGALSNVVTVNVTITPVNDAPVINYNQDHTLNEDQPFELDALGFASDPEGDAMTLELGETDHGTTQIVDGKIVFTPTANFNGMANFAFRVKDAAGAYSGWTTVEILYTPVNDAPVGNNDSYSTNEDQALTVPTAGVLTNDQDVDGNSLTASLVTGPAHGTLTLNADGSFTYTPAANYNGPDNFTYKAYDGSVYSGVVSVSITVNAVNDTPVAEATSVSTDEDTPVTFTLPASDVDNANLTIAITVQPAYGTVVVGTTTVTYTPNANYHGPDQFKYTVSDGQLTSSEATVSVTVNSVNDLPTATSQTGANAVSVTEDTPKEIVLAGTDIDGDALTFTPTAPAHGTLALKVGTTNTFIYTPAANYNGTDNFTFTASDGNGGTSAVATVDINIAAVNDAPVAEATSVTTDEDAPVTFTPPASDVDNTNLTISITIQPEHGTVSVGTNTITYTPNADYHGSDVFSYTVSDGQLTSNAAPVNITVNPVNDAPVGITDSYTTNEDVALTVSAPGLLANDQDVDGDALIAVLVAGPAHGTLTLNADGSFIYTPTANYSGSDNFTYKAKDQNGVLSNVVSVSITVTAVNDAPVATAQSITTNEDVAKSGQLAGTDIEGTILSFAAASQPAHGSVVVNQDGSFIYTPALNYHGTDNFTFTVSDGALTSTPATVSITVEAVNDAPVAISDNFTTNEDVVLTVPAATGVLKNDADVDGDPLTAVVVTGPAHGTLALNADGSFTYTPAVNYYGSDNFTYKATDGSLQSEVVAVSLTINSVNDAPSGKDNTVTILEDQDYTFTAADFGFSDVNDNPANAFHSVKVTSIPVSTRGILKNNGSNVVIGDFITIADITAGKFSFHPAADFNLGGAISFTFKVKDNGGTDNSGVDVNPINNIMAINITPVNDVPVFIKGADVVKNEDAGTQTITAWATGIDDGDPEATQTLTFQVTANTNPTLFATAPAIAADGTLTFKSATNANGSATITVKLTDNGGTENGGVAESTEQTFTITILSVNDAPVGAENTLTIMEDEVYTFKVADFGFSDLNDQPANDFHSVRITSIPVSTRGILKNNGSNVVIGDFIPVADITAGKFQFHPAADFNGGGAISFNFKVKDDGGIENGGVDVNPSSNAIAINITPVNDVPVATSQTGANAVSVTEDTPKEIVLAGTDIDGDALTFTPVAPAHGTLVLKMGTTSTFIYTPALNYNGTDQFTFTASDGNGGTSAAATVDINIAAVNDAPSFTKGADRTLLEDAGSQTVPNWATNISAGPVNESSQTVEFIVTTNNDALFAVLPTITGSGTLAYTTAPNANGQATINVKLKDNGGGTDESSVQTFVIDVTPVNDVPSFTKGPDQTVAEDAPGQTVSGWASAISAGPSNESAQSVQFNVSNNNTSLFTVQPSVSATGVLTYTLAADANGSATVTVSIKDNGGKDNGGVDESQPQTFTINVTAVNDVPSFTKGLDQSVLEDAPAQTISGWAKNISAGPANESAQSVQFLVTNNNTALFSVQPAVSPEGVLTYTLAANANGLAIVSVKIKDNGGTTGGGVDESVAQTFEINVTAVNDAPSFTRGADQTVAEDAPAQSVGPWAIAISKGPADEIGQTVAFNVLNNNNALFSVQPAIAPNGTLTYTVAPNANGVATVTVSIQDNGGTTGGGTDVSGAQTFTITVNAVNDVPVFTKGQDVTVDEDAGAQTINSWATGINDGDPELSQGLTFSVTNNSRISLFSVQPSIDANGNLTFTPAANANGSATITITLSDDGSGVMPNVNTTASQTFVITVRSVNDEPTGADKTVGTQEDMAYTFGVSDFSVSDANDNPANTLKAVVLTTLPAKGNLKLNGSNITIAGTIITLTDITDGNLKFSPAANENGSPYTSFTFQVQDNGGTAYSGVDVDQSANVMTINVTDVNDVPVFMKGGNETILEDAAAKTVTNWATGIDDGDQELVQTLTFNVTNNNNALFSAQPTISAAGTLTYTLAANANGSATVTVSLSDDGSGTTPNVNTSASQTFTITVTPVNDAPSFTKGADVTRNEDAGLQTITNWASSISKGGGSDEGTQAVAFVVTGNTMPSLFASGPVVAANGTLTFTPAPNANGTAIITVRLTDDGGTANGGVNASTEQTFTITINSVNDAPAGDNKTVTTLEDNTYTFGETDFGFSDVNDNPVNAFHSVKIASLPLAGTLKNDETTVAVNSFISMADITSGKLKFYPAANGNGSPYASFTFQVKDDGGMTNGGADLDPTANTITINVTAVNDVPVFTKGANKTVDEDAGAQIFAGWATSISKGGGSDEDGQQLTFVVTGNSNPSLFVAGPAIAANGTLTFTPADNQFGTATIIVKLKDNGLTANGGVDETSEQSFTITVNPINDKPVITSVTPTTQNVQYSDEIQNVVINASDVDNTSLTATISGLPAGLSMSPANGEANTTGVWTVSGKTTAAPGEYTVTVTVNDGLLTSAASTFKITVTKEDARVTYTGALFTSTSGSTSSTATVTLAATIQDLTAADAIADPNAGDITNARVYFKIVETGETFGPFVPGIVTNGDTKTGTVTYNWTANIGSFDSKQFTVRMIVNNYYVRDASDDDEVVTVSKPLNDFITGGGYLITEKATGKINPRQGVKNNFGFNVKFNKSGTNLQGNINTIIRGSNGKVYQIKGNAMTSLSVKPATATTPGTAIFNGKANIQDITDPNNALSVDGNATLQVTMTDLGDPSGNNPCNDRIAITVWDKSGGLWFTSHWNDVQTDEKQIAKGNLKVSSANAAATGTLQSVVKLTSNDNDSYYGQQVTFTATVTGTSTTKPTGSVTFMDGSKTLATVPLNSTTGVVTFSTSALSIGTHDIAVYYGGDNKYSSSADAMKQVVADGPVTMVAPAMTKEAVKETAIAPMTFNLVAYPNPTTSNFNLRLESGDTKNKIVVRVLDLQGRTVETRPNLSAGQTITLGNTYMPGIYFIEMVQGGKAKQIKVMKQNN